MVKLCDDFCKIAALWSEAFGDSLDDIKYFCDNLKHGECYSLIKNGETASLLFLIDCKLGEHNAKYVYAACTSKRFRKQGCMSELLKYICDEFKYVCLIPADEKLVGYYKNRGFDTVWNVDELSFFENDVINNEYLFEGCSLDKPVVLLNRGK